MRGLAPRRAGRHDRGAPEGRHRSTPSRPCASCTTRPRPASRATSRRCARPSMPRGHPALLMVDSISGLACADYRHDEWGVDVTISGSQKGLMLPPGHQLQRALAQGDRGQQGRAKLPKSFWAWDEMIEMNKTGYFPYTPNTNLLYGLAEACDMLLAPEHGGLRGGVRAPPALGRGRARGREGLGPGDPVRRPGGLFAGAHRRDDAGRRRCRCGAQDHLRALRLLARAPAWARSRARCSASATSATATT